MADDRNISHDLIVTDDKSSVEYRPLTDKRKPSLIEIHKILEQKLEENIKLCSSLPSRDEIINNIDKGLNEDGTQQPWKWTEEEIKIAQQWIDSPLNRVRFLRARSWDINLAADLLFSAVLWRRTFQGKGVNNITSNDVINELKTGKAFFHGYDKVGRPISYIKANLHDGNLRDLNEVQKFCVYMMEKEHNELFKDGIYRSCVIFDLEGFSLRNMDYQFMKFMIHMLQNYYPDTLGVALILNSPWLFSGCWAILKRWIDPASQNKVVFININELSNYIDENIIPKSYNGNDDWEYNYKELL